MAVTVFGGGAVQTAYVSFTALDISLNSITLVWPTSYFDVPSVVDGINYNVLAASMTVDNINGNDYEVILPDATESSVGSNFIITNIGERTFRLQKSNGDELLSIPSEADANSFWVQLIDNSTSVGLWQFLQFGAGTSQAQASSLAGNGLVPLAGLLNTNINVHSIPNAPYQVLLTDRAKLLLWQTGTGQMTLPLIATPVPNGFYISVNNEGSGILTIIGDVTIDNKVSITVAPGQSLSIITDGIKWWSLGFGQNIASSNFAPGSSIAPSITFTSDITTGIYYYQTPFPPIAPPGIGFSVSSSQIANLSLSGLYMNAGKNIVLQDSTNVSQTSLTSNAAYAQLSWNSIGLLNQPTLNITGTNTESTITLGPFGTLSFSQSDTDAAIIFNGNGIFFMDNTGASSFTNPVTFGGPIVINNTSTFSVTSTFNAPIIINDTSTFALTSTFNGPVIMNDTVTLANPLTIADGGTGQNNRQSAINSLLPPAPPIGSMIYHDRTNNWILVSPGIIGNTLTLVDDGFGNPVPQWM